VKANDGFCSVKPFRENITVDGLLFAGRSFFKIQFGYS